VLWLRNPAYNRDTVLDLGKVRIVGLDHLTVSMNVEGQAPAKDPVLIVVEFPNYGERLSIIVSVFHDSYSVYDNKAKDCQSE
jgi:hypothetical protein